MLAANDAFWGAHGISLAKWQGRQTQNGCLVCGAGFLSGKMTKIELPAGGETVIRFDESHQNNEEEFGFDLRCIHDTLILRTSQVYMLFCEEFDLASLGIILFLRSVSSS